MIPDSTANRSSSPISWSGKETSWRAHNETLQIPSTSISPQNTTDESTTLNSSDDLAETYASWSKPPFIHPREYSNATDPLDLTSFLDAYSTKLGDVGGEEPSRIPYEKDQSETIPTKERIRQKSRTSLHKIRTMFSSAQRQSSSLSSQQGSKQKNRIDNAGRLKRQVHPQSHIPVSVESIGDVSLERILFDDPCEKVESHEDVESSSNHESPCSSSYVGSDDEAPDGPKDTQRRHSRYMLDAECEAFAKFFDKHDTLQEISEDVSPRDDSPVLGEDRRDEDMQTSDGYTSRRRSGGEITENTVNWSVILELVLPYLAKSDCLAACLACRDWYHILGQNIAIESPTQRLPPEILRHIYYFLGPNDFNAARHTCQLWMTVSLERSLLMRMLQRGGWWSAVERDLEAYRDCDEDHHGGFQSEEWIMSCRIAMECALSSEWKGNGLERGQTLTGDETDGNAMVPVGTVEFNGLAKHSAHAHSQSSESLLFTPSVCGRYLLVAIDNLIYVYEISDGNIEPRTSVICPREVVAVSMTSSGERYAVAALLHGRMGLVCELHLKSDDELALNTDSPGSDQTEQSSSYNAVDVNSGASRDPGYEFHQLAEFTHTPYPGDDAPNSSTFDSINFREGSQHVELRGTDNQRFHARNLINQAWALRVNGEGWPRRAGRSSFPVEKGQQSLYRHLCSDDDPPRSIALCPQRRCVAFGCSSGIELHWVDALSRQDLNRWFPLTAASDFLYFLPPCNGIDSSRKLRLVSSTAHPMERPRVLRRIYKASYLRGASESCGPAEQDIVSLTTMQHCDHYRAVPLSDGHHMLFTDPDTGALFLGSDAPLGGLTKLLRKFMLLPPRNESFALLPRMYAAASQLKKGVRIVAGYGDVIVLYCIPLDVFSYSQIEESTIPNSMGYTALDRLKTHPNSWLKWWEDGFFDEWQFSSIDSHSIWPLSIRGQVIGECAGLTDLLVNYTPDLSIWALGADNKATIWQINNGRRSRMTSRKVVSRDGIVCDIDETTDTDGEAGEEGSSSQVPEPDVGQPPSAYTQAQSGHYLEQELGGQNPPLRRHWVDEDGDLVMVDAGSGLPILPCFIPSMRGALH